MGRNSEVVMNVERKSEVQALAESVFEQAFRDLNSRRSVNRESARAFLLAEDEGWRNARAFWATLAHQDVQAVEAEVKRQIAEQNNH